MVNLMHTRPRPRSRQARQAYWFEQALLLAIARPDLYREIRDLDFPARGMNYPWLQNKRKYWYQQVVSAIGNPCAYSCDYLIRHIGIYARKLKREEDTHEQVINAAS